MQRILSLGLFFVLQSSLLQAAEHDGFVWQQDVAQYKGSDFANVVQVERGLALEDAFTIAENNPEIDYFVYTKGGMMVLEVPPEVTYNQELDTFGLASYIDFIYDSGEVGRGYSRVFGHGDVVFFGKEGKWLASAPGLADTYVKVEK